MSATIRDVARRAGVSIATVSRVLNASSYVDEAKRALVFEAAEALGYAPHPGALSLHRKGTGEIGALLPFVSGEFFSELLGGLDEAARDLGLLLLISTAHRRPGDFRDAARTLDRRVDGIVVMGPELSADAARALARPGTPAVFVNTRPDGIPADVINFDNAGGIAAVTRHLVELGHRDIVHVRGPERAWDAAERARGYREAMAGAGLAPAEVAGGYSRESGVVAAESLLAREHCPTAVVMANDYSALGMLHALSSAGVAVPDDLSVTGFDGLPSGRFNVPSLTTVHVPVREIGARAVRQLVARMSGKDAGGPRHEVVPVAVRVGASTAAPPASG